MTNTKEKKEDLYTHLFVFTRNRWWLFLLIAAIFATIGFLYALKKPTLYQSKLTFALDDGGGNSEDMSDAFNLASQMGINIGGGGKRVFGSDNIVEIMVSRRTVERTLLSVDTFENKPYTLIDYYLKNLSEKKSNNITTFPVGCNKSNLNYKQDSVLFSTYQFFVKKLISAERPNKKFNIYEVRVKSPAEKFTKVFTDRLVSETNAFYTEVCSKKAKETLMLLEQRVELMKTNLSTTIKDKALIQDANFNPALSVVQTPLLEKQANIQVYGSLYNEMFKNLEMARYQYLKAIPLMQIIDAADYPMMRIKLSKGLTAIIFSLVSQVLLVLILGLYFHTKNPASTLV